MIQDRIESLERDLDVLTKYAGNDGPKTKLKGATFEDMRGGKSMMKTPVSLNNKLVVSDEEDEQVSDESELSKLERDPKLGEALFPGLMRGRPVKILNGGPVPGKGRKRERDGEDEEEGEGAKKRHTERYSLRNGK